MSFTGACTWIAYTASTIIIELATPILFKSFPYGCTRTGLTTRNKGKSNVWFNRTKRIVRNIDWNQCRCCKESRFTDVWFTNQSNSHGLTASLHSSSTTPERTRAMAMSSSGRFTRPSPSRSMNCMRFAISHGGKSAMSALRSACWSS